MDMDRARSPRRPPAVGDFVSFTPTGKRYGRQAVVTEVHSGGTMTLLGESGEMYEGSVDRAVVVPDHKLWGSTLAFVTRFRSRHGQG